MRVVKRYNQNRRDLTIDIQCESCQSKATISAYDDLNYWENVLPNIRCGHCGKTTYGQGLEPEDTSTKYEPYEII